MAISQEQVDAWFAANPNATAEDVAAAVQSIGGLSANEGLAGMIANRYSIAEPEVTNYYNQYTAPKAPTNTNTQTFTDTILNTPVTETDLLTTLGTGNTGTATNTYFQANPDVAASFAANSYGMSADDFANFHWNNYGKTEGRVSPTGTPANTSTLTTTTNNTVDTTGATGSTTGATGSTTGNTGSTTQEELLAALSSPADNITSSGLTGQAGQMVVEGDDIETQIAQLPTEYAHWSRSADQRYMELIRKSDGAILDRRVVGDFSDLDLAKIGLSFIPGAGQILAGLNVADAARRGDILQAAIGATGIIPGMQNVNTALRVGQAVDSGNAFGAVTALAGNSDVQSLLGLGNTNIGGFTAKDAMAAGNLIQAAGNNNYAGILTSLGTLTNSSDTALAGRALSILTRFQNGDTKALGDALSLSSSVAGSTTGGAGSTTGSTTVGDFEDTEVTRLQGLGYTKEQIQEYFRNLDNLTDVFDTATSTVTGGAGNDAAIGATDNNATSLTRSLSALDQLDTTRTADEYADFLASIGITNTTQLEDSGLSNQDILDMINAGVDTLTVTGATGNDTITGATTNDTITGANGNDNIETVTVTGGKGNDTVTGVDTITGGTGNDDVPEIVVKDTRECAPGFHDDGTGLCVADDDKQPLDCQEGYEPNEAGTACIPVVDVTDTRCDPGFVYDEDLKQCVAIGDEDCEPGYHRENGVCVLDECPEGYVRDLATGQCVLPEQDCPTGYHRDEVTGQCVPDTKTLDCPEGYEPNEAGTACIPVVVIQDKKCDPGFVYDEDLKQCVPIEDEPCAPGFHLENGLCVPDGEECKPGFERIGGECVPVCKEGYIRNLETGVCEKVETKECPVGQVRNAEGKCVPITKTTECQPGYERVNGVCVPICQPGYVRVDGVCKKIPTNVVMPSISSYGAQGEKTEPIYAGGMDEFNLLATLQELLKDEEPKKDDKKSKDKTKMATGGHLDDLLAEQMTVDDLLKLLR